MRRNQYYWDQRPSGFKPLNQLEPTHSSHMNICDDAIICCVSSRNKALPGGISVSSKSQRGKRVHQGQSERHIIVYHCNFGVFWHSVSLPRRWIDGTVKDTIARTRCQRNYTRVLRPPRGMVEH